MFRQLRAERTVNTVTNGNDTQQRVFTRFGKPLTTVQYAFTSAVKRAGISDCKFHDLRHTFASQMVMRGAGLKNIQEILGHTTMTMTLRYAHLSQERKRRAVNLINDLASIPDECHESGMFSDLRLASVA